MPSYMLSVYARMDNERQTNFEWRYWDQAVPMIRVSRAAKRSKACKRIQKVNGKKNDCRHTGLRPAIAGAKDMAIWNEFGMGSFTNASVVGGQASLHVPSFNRTKTICPAAEQNLEVRVSTCRSRATWIVPDPSHGRSYQRTFEHPCERTK